MKNVESRQVAGQMKNVVGPKFKRLFDQIEFEDDRFHLYVKMTHADLISLFADRLDQLGYKASRLRMNIGHFHGKPAVKVTYHFFDE